MGDISIAILSTKNTHGEVKIAEFSTRLRKYLKLKMEILKYFFIRCTAKS